jgi:hypothetical protein
MTYKWIEVSIRLIGENRNGYEEVYCQKIGYEYFQQSKPYMVEDIAAVVNNLETPTYDVPMSPQEVEEGSDDQYWGGMAKRSEST